MPIDQPSVSVALATYNGARFLREQLDSLAAQTLQPLELVACDDRSTDDTVAILEDFARVAPFPVRVFRNERTLNYRLNFRKAAQACTGELIAFCDQDDVWRADKLAVMAERFRDPTVMLAYHNGVAFSSTGRRRMHDPAAEKADLAQRPIPPFKSVNGLLQVFRADLRRFDHLWDDSIDQNEGNVILAHDQWYIFLALLLGRVEFVDEELLEYRQHANNTYGVRVKVTLSRKIALKLMHFGDQDRWAALSAARRADITTALGAADNPRLAEIVVFYRDLADRLDRRADTYSAPGVVSRARALLRSVRHGDYGAGGFKRSSIVRDVWSGALLHKRSDPSRHP